MAPRVPYTPAEEALMDTAAQMGYAMLRTQSDREAADSLVARKKGQRKGSTFELNATKTRKKKS